MKVGNKMVLLKEKICNAVVLHLLNQWWVEYKNLIKEKKLERVLAKQHLLKCFLRKYCIGVNLIEVPREHDQ
jgi:hypothetical protein